MPTVTATEGAKFAPLSVNVVPPATGPLAGVSDERVGGLYENCNVLLVTPPSVATTGTFAPAPTGRVHRSTVEAWLCTTHGAPPTVTLAGVASRPTPVRVSVVPPAVLPVAGVSALRAAASPGTRAAGLAWPAAVTTIETCAVDAPGLVHTSWVWLLEVTGQLAPPTVTVGGVTPKSAPEIVSGAPELGEMLAGVMPLMLGAKRSRPRLPSVAWPPAVTVTSCEAPSPSGARTTSWVCVCELTTAVAAPTRTCAPPAPKFAPAMVTAVPPAVDTRRGVRPESTGAWNEKALSRVPVVPSRLVTLAVRLAPVPAGTAQTMAVSDQLEGTQLDAPTVTAPVPCAALNRAPVSVTVPPVVGNAAGLTLEMSGTRHCEV